MENGIAYYRNEIPADMQQCDEEREKDPKTGFTLSFDEIDKLRELRKKEANSKAMKKPFSSFLDSNGHLQIRVAYPMGC